MVRHRRRLPPKPPNPPEGYMYWHGRLWAISAVEALCKSIIGNHDYQSKAQRDRANGIMRYFKLSKTQQRR